MVTKRHFCKCIEEQPQTKKLGLVWKWHHCWGVVTLFETSLWYFQCQQYVSLKSHSCLNDFEELSRSYPIVPGLEQKQGGQGANCNDKDIAATFVFQYAAFLWVGVQGIATCHWLVRKGCCLYNNFWWENQTNKTLLHLWLCKGISNALHWACHEEGDRGVQCIGKAITEGSISELEYVQKCKTRAMRRLFWAQGKCKCLLCGILLWQIPTSGGWNWGKLPKSAFTRSRLYKQSPVCISQVRYLYQL